MNIIFGWSGSFRFYGNEFEFRDPEVTKVCFLDLLMEVECYFRKIISKIAIYRFLVSTKNFLDVQKLSWAGREAYIVKDDSYYEAMIRKNNQLPETVRLEILIKV